MFLASKSGITIVELSVVPLSAGSMTQENGPGAGGTPITIRGSGFQSGTVLKFGDTAVAATFVDENTVKVTSPPHPPGAVRITIIHPDGRQYKLDAAFQYQ